jgi:hypothetical protein
MAVHMLTTVDNPWDPFTQFDEWYQFDESSGYHTTQYLARLTFSSPDLSEVDQSDAIEVAIDEIVEQNVLGIYKKVEAPANWEDQESLVS